MMSVPFGRKHVSVDGLLRTARQVFAQIPDAPGHDIVLVDHLMSGLALFGLKYPSLLQFEQDCREATTRANLESLYGIERAPSDTRFRERLDALDPGCLQPLYKAPFAQSQRGKGLEGFDYLDGHYCSPSTAPGISPPSKCPARSARRSITETAPRRTTTRCWARCWCIRITRRSSRSRPRRSSSPTGQRKTIASATSAAKRLLRALRRAHPPRKLIVVEDGLPFNGPHIRHLQALDFKFILGAKQGDHQAFDWVDSSEQSAETTFTDAHGYRHRFRYLNAAPLNDANFNLEVNFLEYWEHAPDGTVTHFAWVTDIPITDANLMTLMRGARARWKIENETFNTLENQGYHFEHNFGHGRAHLSTVLMHLMMLAFLIDQIQQGCCRLFQAALTAPGSKARLWRKLRTRFDLCLIPDWETLWRSIIAPSQLALGHDTS